MRLHHFLLPVFVGVVFGVLLVREIAFRRFLARAKAYMEARHRQVESLNLALARQVDELTRELARTQALLLRADRQDTIGRLAHAIAHDFNNVLGVILGSTELLAHQTREDREAIESIETAARRGHDLYRQLVRFVSAGGTRPERICVGKVAGELVPMLRRLLGPAYRVDLDAQPGDCAVLFDAALLEHVLLNLVMNARDAMEKGGRIALAVRPVTRDARAFVLLEVADEGVGMDDTVAARAFEPFFTTKPPERGTGLGLHLVKTTVEAAGGRVEVDSAPGAGTRMRVILPTVSPPADPG